MDEYLERMKKKYESIVFPSTDTPREEFEGQFGPITDEQWEWVKQFCLRNPVTGHGAESCTVVDCPRLKKEIWWDNKS